MIEYFLLAFVAAGGTAAASSKPDGAAEPGTGGSAQAQAQAPAPVTPAPQAVSPSEFKNPVKISADRFEIQGKRREAVWVGNVRAVRGPTVLTCERLIAHYTKQQEITRIECVGHVEAVHNDMWAKGERADFDNVAGVLTVTGSPEARKGVNQLRGAKIVFDVGRDTISVEGGAQTVFPSLPTRGKKR